MPNCKRCSNPIQWIKTKAGKNIPVDPLKLTIVTDAGEVVQGYESHFSTCPYADEFRTKRPGRVIHETQNTHLTRGN